MEMSLATSPMMTELADLTGEDAGKGETRCVAADSPAEDMKTGHGRGNDAAW